MILSGRLFEEKKLLKCCGFPSFNMTEFEVTSILAAKYVIELTRIILLQYLLSANRQQQKSKCMYIFRQSYMNYNTWYAICLHLFTLLNILKFGEFAKLNYQYFDIYSACTLCIIITESLLYEMMQCAITWVTHAMDNHSDLKKKSEWGGMNYLQFLLCSIKISIFLPNCGYFTS